jgi:hypothetical protein
MEFTMDELNSEFDNQISEIKAIKYHKPKTGNLPMATTTGGKKVLPPEFYMQVEYQEFASAKKSAEYLLKCLLNSATYLKLQSYSKTGKIYISSRGWFFKEMYWNILSMAVVDTKEFTPEPISKRHANKTSVYSIEGGHALVADSLTR